MDEKDSDFKEKVKNSFLKAKEDYNNLQNQIKELKEIILRQEEQNKLLRQKELDKMADNLYQGLLNDKIEKVSSGNEGVATNKQTNKHETITQQITDIDALKDKYRSVTKQKLRLYLAIYNMEEEKKPITYKTLSKYLKLSEETVRVYIFRMLEKDIPLEKHRVNNKLIVFKIPQHIRSLNLKQFLEDLYYGIDDAQGRLTDL
jgi:hypothetical protein